MKRLFLRTVTLLLIALFVSPVIQVASAQLTTTVACTIKDMNNDGINDVTFRATDSLGNAENVQIQVFLGPSLIFIKSTAASGQTIVYDPPAGAYSWIGSNGQTDTFQIIEHTYSISSEAEVLQWLIAIDFMNSHNKGRSLYQNISQVFGYDLSEYPMPIIDSTNSNDNLAISAAWINWSNGLVEHIAKIQPANEQPSDLSQSFIDILTATSDGLSDLHSIQNTGPSPTINVGEVQGGGELSIADTPVYRITGGGLALFSISIGVLDLLNLNQKFTSLKTTNLAGLPLETVWLQLTSDGFTLIAGVGNLIYGVINTGNLKNVAQDFGTIFGTAAAALGFVITITDIYQELQTKGFTENLQNQVQLWIQILSLGTYSTEIGAVLIPALINFIGWAGIESIGEISTSELASTLASTLGGIASGIGLVVVTASLIAQIWRYITDLDQTTTEMSPILTQLWQIRSELIKIDPTKLQVQGTISLDLSNAAGRLVSQITQTGNINPAILNLKDQLQGAKNYWYNLSQAETTLSSDAPEAVSTINQFLDLSCYDNVQTSPFTSTLVQGHIVGILSVDGTVVVDNLNSYTGIPDVFSTVASYYQPKSTDQSNGNYPQTSYYETLIEHYNSALSITSDIPIVQTDISSQTNLFFPTGWAWDKPTQQDSSGIKLAVFYRPQSNYNPNNFLFEADGNGNQYADYYQHALPLTPIKPFYLMKFYFDTPLMGPSALSQWENDLFGENGKFDKVRSSVKIAYESINKFEQASVFQPINEPLTYDIIFSESGLPTSTPWSVNLSGKTKTSPTNTITFNVPNGIYTYSVTPPSGYTTTDVQASGSISISGSAVTKSLQFTTIGSSNRIDLSSPTINGLTVNINGAASPINQVFSVQWNWGDSSAISYGFPGSHTYTKSGTYHIIVTAYYFDGSTAQASTTVTVSAISNTFEIYFGGGGSGSVSYSYNGGSGTVSSNQQPLYLQVLSGMQISLTANPNGGSGFAGWAGATGVTLSNSKSLSTTVTMYSGNGAVMAYFILTNTVSITSLNGGSVSYSYNGIPSGTVTGTIPSGQTKNLNTVEGGTLISITANPNTGYTFSSWAVSGPLTLSSSSSTSSTLTVNGNGGSLTAIYAGTNSNADPNSWPMFHNDGLSGYSTSTAPITNNTKWHYNIGGANAPPIIESGILYIGSMNGNFYALNATTGNWIWTFNCWPVWSSAAIANGIVYVSTNNGNLYAINAATGVQIWSKAIQTNMYSSPVVSNDIVYVGSNDLNVYALNAETGAVVWQKNVDGQLVMASPAVLNGIVYIDGYDGTVFAFNALTGAKIWSSAWLGGTILSSPAIANGVIYVCPQGSYAYALNATTGLQKWRSSDAYSNIYSSPAVANGIVYIPSNDGLHALNATTGSQIWISTATYIHSSPAVAGGTVFVGSEDGNLHAFNATTGVSLWVNEIGTTGANPDSSPVVASGIVYIGSGDGNVYAFGPQFTTSPVSFTESGLALGTQWFVTFNNQTQSTTSNSMTFNVPDGNYNFSINPPTGYLVLQGQSGNVTVNHSSVAQSVYFAAISSSNYIALSPPAINGLTVDINGGASPGDRVSYIEWNWGDGSVVDSWFPSSHSYAQSGTYTITVTALYLDGNAATKSIRVYVYPGERTGGYMLNVIAGSGGSILASSSLGTYVISPNAQGSLYLAFGDSVGLTANPNPDSTFSTWTIPSDITIIGGSSNSPTITIAVNNDGNVTANFESTSKSISDNFTQDSSLNTNLWQVNGPVGTLVGVHLSDIPNTIVTPNLTFSPTNGMGLSGVTSNYQSATIQSVHSFSTPFTVTANVMSTQSYAVAFFLGVSTADGIHGVVIDANLASKSGYLGMWYQTATGVNNSWTGYQGPIVPNPSLNISYQVSISIDSTGMATLRISSQGNLLGTANVQVGTGTYYVILGQREGAPDVTGPNQAYWQSISLTPSATLTFTNENVNSWYWTGTTSIKTTAIGDLNGDGHKEIVTGGSYYDGSRNVAQLVVWNPLSNAVENLKTWYWTGDTKINSVAIGDVNGDGQTEIVTGGSYFDGARNVAQLVVWNSSNLAAEKIMCWYWTGNSVINSVALGDVDSDGQNEIVTSGYYNDGSSNIAQLCVWNGSSLGLENVKAWYWTSNTVINSVAIGDVDADGQVEIVTGGSYFDGTRNVAQLVEWSGANLAVDRLSSWYWTGNTVINSVALGDVDGDGQVEIVTGGSYFDGTRNNAQLVEWSGSSLAVDRLTGWYWTGNTVINSVSIGNVCSNGQTEVVTGGQYNDGTRDVAQLVVWAGSSLAAEQIKSWYWTNNTAINSVVIGDVNSDFSNEIVTGGMFHDGIRSNSQITIWGMV